MGKLIKYICLIIAFFTITSCSYDDMAEKLVPKEEVNFAENYISELRSNNFEYIKNHMSQKILKQANDELLSKMAQQFRSGELLSTELIGSQVHIFNGVWNGNFTFEYHFSSGWNLANAALKKVNGSYEVTGLNIYSTSASQRELNAFTFSSKTLLHYFILLMSILVSAFILITVYFCIKTPIAKRKWLWVMFILLGIGIFKINWTTGQFFMQLVSVQLFGSSAMANSPHAPWLISVSFPLGAIVFWFKRKSFLASIGNVESSQIPAKK